MYSLIGLVILVLDIIAIVSILKSSADTGTKLLWVVLVILLPLVGMILYFLMGPGAGTSNESSNDTNINVTVPSVAPQAS